MKLALLVLALLSLLIALLLGLSLAARRHGSEVCLTWKGRDSCGRAWAATPEEARRAAADNACGPISRGMAERMACARVRPSSVRDLR